MKTAESGWSAEHSQKFSDAESMVRGYIRYEVTRSNLQRTLDDFLQAPRRIVDVGGGEGGDAAWLSNLPAGHEVVLVEPDSKNLGKAVARTSRIRSFIRGDSQRALDIYGDNCFDLVVSHGVLQYVRDPSQELSNLSRLVKPDGYLSLLSAGKFGKLRRYEQIDDVVERLVLDGKFVNNLGAWATAYLPQEMDDMIKKAGLETVGWFGTKVLSDGDIRRAEDVSAFELNRILSEELRLSNDPTRKPEGQMLHFIAKKT